MRYCLIALIIFSAGTYSAGQDQQPVDKNYPVVSLLNDDMRFSKFVSGVKNGDSEWLRFVPLVAEKIDNSQVNQLMDALTASLIRSPNQTLSTLADVDELIKNNGHSTLLDRLGSGVICSSLPDNEIYTKRSTDKYYLLAKKALSNIGPQGEKCLKLMADSVDEVNYDAANNKLKWGDKDYFKTYF